MSCQSGACLFAISLAWFLSCSQVSAQVSEAAPKQGYLILSDAVHVMIQDEPVRIDFRVYSTDELDSLIAAKCAEYDPPLTAVLAPRATTPDDTMCSRFSNYITKAVEEYRDLSSAEQAQHHLYLASKLAKSGETCELVQGSFDAAVALDPPLRNQTSMFSAMGNYLLNAGCYDNAFARYNDAHDLSFGLGLSFDKTGHVQYEDVYSVGYPHTCRFRIRHDIEQLEFLLDGSTAARGQQSPNTRELLGKALQAYRTLAEHIGIQDWTTSFARSPPREGSTMPYEQDTLQDQEQVLLDASQWNLIGPYYGRTLWVPPVPRLSGPALTPRSDFAQLTQDYFQSGVLVLDGFLTAEALQGLHEYALEATIWVDNKHSYLGTYLKTGFGNPLLAQVAEELEEAMPEIFQARKLKQAWAYKYDDRSQSGINIHADTAGVNLNFWTTPDEANLDSQSGGLIVFPDTSSDGLSFDEYNVDVDEDKAQVRLAASGFKNVTVPYRCNRAVLFPSELFHTTDMFKFRRGYKSRRINFTLLYGARADGASVGGKDASPKATETNRGSTQRDEF